MYGYIVRLFPFVPFYVIGKHQPHDIIVVRSLSHLALAVYGDIFPFVSRIETEYCSWE